MEIGEVVARFEQFFDSAMKRNKQMVSESKCQEGKGPW